MNIRHPRLLRYFWPSSFSRQSLNLLQRGSTCAPQLRSNIAWRSITYSLTRNMTSATTFYDFKPLDKKGEPYPTEDLKGKVVLVVNTASKCGYTPQFKGLEELYQSVKKSPKGEDFQILGFPCNQFLNQDPGTNDEIQNFCQVNYGVSFPVLGKTNVNGNNAEPVYEWMKKEKPGLWGIKAIKWNFEKFLIGRDGKVKGRWASKTKPQDIEDAIKKELETEAKSEL